MSEDCPFCIYNNSPRNCHGCFEGSNFRPKPMTNADRIRSLSDEELAEQLYLLRLDALRLEGFEGFIETKDEVLEWLKEEVKGGGM